jgi:hypothetical protein
MPIRVFEHYGIKRLGDTLFQGVLDTEQSRLYVETKTMRLNAKQLARIRAVLEWRANTFIAAPDGEFRARTAPEANGETKRMGVSVFSWEEDKER